MQNFTNEPKAPRLDEQGKPLPVKETAKEVADRESKEDRENKQA